MTSTPSGAESTRPSSPSPSQLPPIPGSPTFTYASTANRLSTYTLPAPPPPRPAHAILTKADLEASQIAYGGLLATAKAYRQALAALSETASAFGASLEACARLKESRADALGPPGNSSLSNSFTTKGSCTADMLLSASGVHHLVANHQQILSETVYRSFEVPLLHELDKWRGAIEDENESYKHEVATRSKEIRKLEKEGLRVHKQRRRDVGKFREHLVELTNKLDGLTTLHGEHARTMLRESQDTSVKILDASCSLVRAEVDIFESLARKGWSGGGLDDLLEKGRDLFASDDEALAGGTDAATVAAATGDGTRLFSILPPKSILADSTASESGRHRGHGRSDSLLVDTDRYQSLAGAVDREGDRADTDSIFSEFNQSRGVRPFSPQPIRRHPTDVILDPDSLLIGSSELEGAGARDASAQELQLDEHENGDSDSDNTAEAEESPWKDVVIGSRKASGETATDISTAKDREQRWGVADEDNSGAEDV
ncbi:putative IMD domain-containing protein [Seiridium cardinale]